MTMSINKLFGDKSTKIDPVGANKNIHAHDQLFKNLNFGKTVLACTYSELSPLGSYYRLFSDIEQIPESEVHAYIRQYFHEI